MVLDIGPSGILIKLQLYSTLLVGPGGGGGAVLLLDLVELCYCATHR